MARVQLVILLALCPIAIAQNIRLYSEFERFDPWGNVIPADRDLRPREILSPAMPRNGHLSLQVVVTAPPGTNYFLYVVSNPPGVITATLYREHFMPCGTTYCPDWLTPQNSPSFGAIPESIRELPDQTSRSYLLDLWSPPDVPPRRVRVEALLKLSNWLIAPLEVRIVNAAVPSAHLQKKTEIACVNDCSSRTAQLQLLRYITGQPPVAPEKILRLRDVIQRNAAEDMLLARSFGPSLMELSLMANWPFRLPRIRRGMVFESSRLPIPAGALKRVGSYPGCWYTFSANA